MKLLFDSKECIYVANALLIIDCVLLLVQYWKCFIFSPNTLEMIYYSIYAVLLKYWYWFGMSFVQTLSEVQYSFAMLDFFNITMPSIWKYVH